MEARRVVVTGIGALTPIGNNLQTYWEGLISGKSGAALITLFDASNFKTTFACEVKDFNPTDFLKTLESYFAPVLIFVMQSRSFPSGIPLP